LDKLKPHKSVEQIAKKHRLEVSFVRNQLEMGIPIEHEHTGDKILATDIALQHLDEIPDYYTRLKKMEASAKKEHKKFKDVKEGAVQDLEAGLKKLDNTSYNSIDKLMRRIMKNKGVSAKKLHNDFVNKYHKTPDTWIKDMKEAKEESRYCKLCGKMETRNQCSWGGNFWDRYSIKKYDPNMPHPGNFPESFEINPKAHRAASKQAKIRNLAAKTDNPGERQAAETKLKNKTDLPKFKKEETSLFSRIISKTKVDELVEGDPCWDGYTQVGMKKKNGKKVPNCVPSKGVPKAKGYQKKYQKEDITIEDANGNTFVEIVDLIKSEPLVKEAKKMKGEDPCWKGYEMIGKKNKGGKEVPNCVPKEQKSFESFMAEASAAWQRKEGKNSKGGLNEKGRKSYEREHPGSDLKAPQPKGGSRRDSFCARMKGMKAKLTSAKTAHDPDSRINKSLRAWNC
jgi:hypothetical protein